MVKYPNMKRTNDTSQSNKLVFAFSLKASRINKQIGLHKLTPKSKNRFALKVSDLTKEKAITIVIAKQKIYT